jgi:hypothetical protein
VATCSTSWNTRTRPYAGQRIFVVRREDYVHLVPFVEDEQTVFLKTIIPSGEGLPYQTLISSVLHKYASGRLKEV